MLIHCFHGFLGDPSDFDFLAQGLKGRGIQIRAYDMGSLCSGNKERAFKALESEINKEDVLLGYSFGARFALEAMERFEAKKLFMLAGHIGLRPEELEQRKEIEEEFIKKIRSLSFARFVEWWNKLELFAHDRPIEPRAISDETMANMFREFGLSRQKNLESWASANADKLVWLCGEKDQKYLRHVEERVGPLGVKCRYLEAGHRLLQKEEDVLNIVKEELGL